MRNATVVLASVVVVGLLACGSSSDRSSFDEPTTEPTAAPSDTSSAPGASTGPIGTGDVGSVNVTLDGTVYAPNGSLPLSNALVYVTSQEPGAIPDGAYCDQCLTLPDGTFAVSASDGTFEISSQLPKGKQWLVVQKGQFRRVRELTLDKDDTIALDKDMTTIPGKGDASKGDSVPKMVVLTDDDDFDHIYESLNKLGITDFEKRSDRSLLKNQAELMKYHIVFVPCGDNADETTQDPNAQANMQAFVNAGGKLYVTDWSYEFVRQPFPGFLNWDGETSELGSAASGDEWDADATAQDQGLADWLAATGDATFQVEGNWTTITNVATMPGKDENGADTTIEPTVWVTANKDGHVYPTTVSFQNQCGRVLFSTYHTESGFGGSTELLAQEKALLYVLLEVGVCVGTPPGSVN